MPVAGAADGEQLVGAAALVHRLAGYAEGLADGDRGQQAAGLVRQMRPRLNPTGQRVRQRVQF